MKTKHNHKLHVPPQRSAGIEYGEDMYFVDYNLLRTNYSTVMYYLFNSNFEVLSKNTCYKDILNVKLIEEHPSNVLRVLQKHSNKPSKIETFDMDEKYINRLCKKVTSTCVENILAREILQRHEYNELLHFEMIKVVKIQDVYRVSYRHTLIGDWSA